MWKVITSLLLTLLVAGSISTRPAPVPEVSEELREAIRFQATAIMQTYYNVAQVLGQVKPMEELQAEGWIPFPLTNLVTGAPMRNVCDRESPGDYCLKIASPTKLDAFYFSDGSDPKPRSFKFSLSPPFPGMPFERFPGARKHNYNTMDLKLMVLGLTVTWRVCQGAQARVFRGWDKPAIESLYREPTRRLIDPRNGTILEFDGRGYGSLVRVDQIHPDLALIRVIEGNEIVYAATVGSGAFIPPDKPMSPFTPRPDLVMTRFWPAPETDLLDSVPFGNLLRPYLSGYTLRSR